MYLIAKHSHLTIVLLSVTFLVIRVIAVSMEAQWLSKKWAKVSPHIIDTLLLISAIVLMVLISQYPIQNAWLTAKVLGVLCYIAFGFMAFKGDKSFLTRFAYLGCALLSVAYIAGVAITKTAIFW